MANTKTKAMESFAWVKRTQDALSSHLNFMRCHVLAFSIVPLICSGIFYGANGEYHIAYIDCLFLCYSAMTVTGLSPVLLSTITPFQQAMLFVLMVIGDFSFVSWLMVLVRKNFFVRHCEGILEAQKWRREARTNTQVLRDEEKGVDQTLLKRLTTVSKRGPKEFHPLVREKTEFSYQGFNNIEKANRAPFIHFLDHKVPRKRKGFGGFPTPISIVISLFRKILPKKQAATLKRTITINQGDRLLENEGRPWLNFDLIVGRNSKFKLDELSDEQIEELGGVEYAALQSLTWIIPMYFIGTQLLIFIVLVAYLQTRTEFDGVFEAQPRLVPKSW